MSSLTLARNSQVGTLEAGFKVLGQPSVAIEPSESALDNPAPRQDDKAADGMERLTISMVHWPILSRVVFSLVPL
jgi:hypothetical protein